MLSEARAVSLITRCSKLELYCKHSMIAQITFKVEAFWNLTEFSQLPPEH